MSSPRVSILIPTFRQEQFIAEAVESALAQDYPNLEVIVADDCSPDNTFSVTQQFESHPALKCHRNETNLGRVGNYRNSLYTLATGQWVINLDGDDFFTDTTFVRRAMEAAASRDNVVLVGCGHHVCHADRREFKPVARDMEFLDGFELMLQWNTRAVAHMAACYHRQTALETDFYRSDTPSSDWESMLRLLLKGNAILLPGSAGCWRQHGANETARLDFSIFEKNLAAILNPAQAALENGRDRQTVELWKDRLLSDSYRWFLTRNCLALGETPQRAAQARENLTRLKAQTAQLPVALRRSPDWRIFALAGGRAVRLFFALKQFLKTALAR